MMAYKMVVWMACLMSMVVVMVLQMESWMVSLMGELTVVVMVLLMDSWMVPWMDVLMAYLRVLWMVEQMRWDHCLLREPHWECHLEHH